MKLVHNNTIEYAKKAGFSLSEYETGFYGANGSSKFVPLRYYQRKDNMVDSNGNLDPVKVENNFFNQITRILDWISIKNYSVLKLYGVADLFPEDPDYQIAIRKAVYKVLNEYQRYGVDSEVRNPLSISADVTAELSVGAYLTSADFTGSEGWNAINRLSLDKWELGIDGLPSFKGATVDLRNKTGDSWFKTAIAKIGSNDPLTLPTVLYMNKAISEFLGGGDLVTDITEVPTPNDLTASALQAKYDSTGLYLESEQVTLKSIPIGATERQATENETIFAQSTTPSITEKIQFVNGKVVVLSQNVTILDLIADLTLAVSLLDNVKANKADVVLKDGTTDMDPNYNPVRDLQVTTLKKVRSEIATITTQILGNNASANITQLTQLLNALTNRVEQLENAEIIDNKVITYNKPLANLVTNIATEKDQYGNPFIFTVPSSMVVNVYHTADNQSTDSQLITTGDPAPKHFVVTKDGSDLEFDMSISGTGDITIANINNPYAITDIGISTLIQNPYGTQGVASKQDLLAETQARQQADNLKQNMVTSSTIEGGTTVEQILNNLSANKLSVTASQTLKNPYTFTDGLQNAGGANRTLKADNAFGDYGTTQFINTQHRAGIVMSGVVPAGKNNDIDIYFGNPDASSSLDGVPVLAIRDNNDANPQIKSATIEKIIDKANEPASSGGIPTRKDITSTYATRKWNANDAGKKVYITTNGAKIMKVGFISEGTDTRFSDGGAVVDLGINFTDSTVQYRLFWSTEHVSNVGSISLKTDNHIDISETAFDITKFEIEE